MKTFFLSLVATFLLFTSTLIAQETGKTKISESIENVSQTLSTHSVDSLQVNQDVVEIQQTVANTNETKDTIIESQGFSINSLWRGVLGMVTLVFIAFLFSSNRKAINWKIVGIGLAFQLLIAIGVLKVKFIQAVFEFVGGIFIEISAKFIFLIICLGFSPSS